jgi:hypothetical protein
MLHLLQMILYALAFGLLLATVVPVAVSLRLIIGALDHAVRS